jgi:hypothetical protein
MEEYLDLLKLILPVMLVEHFDLVKSEQLEGKFNLYFEERNVAPTRIKHKAISV